MPREKKSKAARRSRVVRWPTAPPYPPYLPEQSQTLDCLPEDVLLVIIDFCATHVRKDVSPLFVAYTTRLGGSLLELSLTNKHFRALCIPKLFRQAMLSDYRDSGKYVGEDKLYQKMLRLKETPVILDTIRYLRIACSRMQPYHFELPKTLIHTLNAMHNLQELHMRLWTSAESLILSTLQSYETHSDLKLKVPSVKAFAIETLEPGNSRHTLDCFSHAFPNLEAISLTILHTPRGMKIIEELGKLETLQTLLLEKSCPNPRQHIEDGLGWTVDDVELLHAKTPNIKYLALKGALEDCEVSQFVHIISHFNKLEQLDITDEQVIDRSDIDMEYDMDEDDIFEDMIDETVDLVIEHPLNEDREETAKDFFEHNPSLKRVCFNRPILCSGQLFEAIRDDEGTVTEAKLIDDAMEPLDGLDDHVIEWDGGCWPKVMKLSID